MMKQYIIIFGLLSLLFFSAVPTIAETPVPVVRLPSGNLPVKLRAVYGDESWFDITLTIPQGYDVTNGTYPGWCVELETIMTRGVNHDVKLYSSYDPSIPSHFISDNWDKVNYVINHHQLYSRESIQEVIWFFICNDPVPTNDTDAQSLIDDANSNGDGFIPSFNQKIAILADVVNSSIPVQRTFFEFTLPSQVILGDLVWNDWNADGIQDAGEPGIPGINVSLYTENGTLVYSEFTDSRGYYLFSYFPLGEYYIQFNLPPGYLFSPNDQGADDTKDSDPNPKTGKTSLTTFDPEQYNTTLDAGMYIPLNPDDPQTPIPPEEPNHPPTADGTAGEPYINPFGTMMIFNGSRSYDSDGRIESWHWSFGDGTTANGIVVTHNYTEVGTYLVTLTVTDDDGATDTYTTNARIKPPNQPPLPPIITGPSEGNQKTNYIFNIVTTDPDDNNVSYQILWDDGSENTTLFFKSGYSIDINHEWDKWGFYTIQVYARDSNNLTSSISKSIIAIDVEYVGNFGYLINNDGIGQFDAFFSNLTQNQTSVSWEQNGLYLIDTDGDGKYDHQYNPVTDSIQMYPGNNYLLVPFVGGMIVVILLLILVGFLIKRRRIKPYQ